MGRIEVKQDTSCDPGVPRDACRLAPGAMPPSAMSGVFGIVILCVVDQYIGARGEVAQSSIELRIAMFQVRGIDDAPAASLNAVSVSSLGMIQRERFHRDF